MKVLILCEVIYMQCTKFDKLTVADMDAVKPVFV